MQIKIKILGCAVVENCYFYPYNLMYEQSCIFFCQICKRFNAFYFFLLAKIVFFFIKMKDGISYFKDPHILTQNNDLKHVFWCLSANSCYKNGYKKAQYIVSMQIFIIIIIGSFKKSLDFFKASYILISLHFYNS